MAKVKSRMALSINPAATIKMEEQLILPKFALKALILKKRMGEIQ